MREQDVAREYSETQGLEFVGKGMLPVGAPSLPGMAACVSVVRGRIADLAQGLVFQTMRAGPDATRGVPGAQFEIAGLGDCVEWLWARRSGRSLWTRVKLPRQLTEVMLESEPLMARYRIAARDIARDGRFARLLFDEVFAGWLLERAPQEEGVSPIGTSFEIWRGTVSVVGPRESFQAVEKLTAFAAAAAQIADRVRTVVTALQPGSPPGGADDAVGGTDSDPLAPSSASEQASVSLSAAGQRSVDRARYGNVADEIEAGLRACGAWDGAVPDGPAQGAFGAPDRSFTQWLRYDLLPRLREVAEGRADPPNDSMVGTEGAPRARWRPRRGSPDRRVARARPACRIPVSRACQPPRGASVRHISERDHLAVADRLRARRRTARYGGASAAGLASV